MRPKNNQEEIQVQLEITILIQFLCSGSTYGSCCGLSPCRYCRFQM